MRHAATIAERPAEGMAAAIEPATTTDHFSALVQRRLAAKTRVVGFAAMSPEQRKELASRGGKRRSELGVGHQFTSQEAAAAQLASGAARVENGFQELGVNLSDFDSLEQMQDAVEKYRSHRSGAARRGIGFEFTFSQWWSVWKESGRWDQRGCSAADSYVMARPRDTGPYSVGNVYITTLSQNFVESWETSPNRMAHRRKATAPVVPSNT
ncbi:MAG: hypothetical protein JWR07_1942 [Nevskia sp.]|nr:hypothetical protein [Nevskia sp.]